MQSVFVIITKLVASKKYFCKEVFCNDFGRVGSVLGLSPQRSENTFRSLPKHFLDILAALTLVPGRWASQNSNKKSPGNQSAAYILGLFQKKNSVFGLFWGYEEALTLKTLTSLNKEVRPSFLVDNSIWSFPSVYSLSDYSIWSS